MKEEKTIYTFWEPKEKLTPYLELCIEKWKPFIQGFNHVLLDYSNLYSYIPRESLDLEKIKSLSLMHQKDIIQATVLRHNGGIFMDADMILLGNIFSICDKYEEYHVVTFAYHVAFMIARPKAKLVEEWYQEVINRLTHLPGNSEVAWDYFANDIINEKLKNKAYKAFQIQKLKTAFTPEQNYFKSINNPEDTYLKFWFSEKIQIESAMYEDQYVIALHNSWTPEWYKQLTRAEILSHSSLLSRILAYNLTSNESRKQPKVKWIHVFQIKLSSKLRRVIG